MKINYSPQFEIMIKALKDFDRADFEAWYFANLPVGSKNLLEYILFKDKENRSKIILPKH